MKLGVEKDKYER